MATTIVDELITLLGFKVDPKAAPTLHKFSEGVKSVNRAAMIAGAGLLGAATAVMYFAERVAESGTHIERFHKLTGMSTDAIQRWAHASEKIGGSKEAILSDMESIIQRLNPIMPRDVDQGFQMFFGTALPNIKTFAEFAERIAPIMQKMEPPRAMQWGRTLGISSPMVLLMRDKKALDKALAEARPLSPKQIAAAESYRNKWIEIKNAIDKFSKSIGSTLLPHLEKILNASVRWWSENEKVINQGLDRFLGAVNTQIDKFAEGIKKLGKFDPIFQKVVEAITDPKILGGVAFTALLGIATVLGLIATKYIAIGAAIALAAAGYHDMYELTKPNEYADDEKEAEKNRKLLERIKKEREFLDEKIKREDKGFESATDKDSPKFKAYVADRKEQHKNWLTENDNARTHYEKKSVVKPKDLKLWSPGAVDFFKDAWGKVTGGEDKDIKKLKDQYGGKPALKQPAPYKKTSQVELGAPIKYKGKGLPPIPPPPYKAPAEQQPAVKEATNPVDTGAPTPRKELQAEDFFTVGKKKFIKAPEPVEQAPAPKKVQSAQEPAPAPKKVQSAQEPAPAPAIEPPHPDKVRKNLDILHGLEFLKESLFQNLSARTGMMAAIKDIKLPPVSVQVAPSPVVIRTADGGSVDNSRTSSNSVVNNNSFNITANGGPKEVAQEIDRRIRIFSPILVG